MKWSDIPFDPPRSTLRQFAGLWLTFFAGWAAWQALARHNATATIVLAAVSLSVGVTGLIRPEWARPLFVAWMVAAFPVGWAVSQVLLAVLFYGLFSPLGLVFRLFGRDPLALRPPASPADSYWELRPAPLNVRRYFRQY